MNSEEFENQKKIIEEDEEESQIHSNKKDENSLQDSPNKESPRSPPRPWKSSAKPT